MWPNARVILFSLILTAAVTITTAVFAGEPSGNNYFQLLLPAGLDTGGDRSGDGGSGNPNDYNYFYVGQTFTTDIQIVSEHTNSANIWVDYNTSTFSATNLTTGSYFPTWSNYIISGGRVKSTGFRVSGYSSGAGTFGTMQFTVLRPTAFNYGTGSAATLLVNVGTVGLTTESNISYLGSDILDDKEDFMVQTWADTKPPYSTNPDPADSSTGTAVEGSYAFDLRDSKNGDGDNSGYGTGINTLMGAGAGHVVINGIDYPSSAVSFSCASFKYGCYLYNVSVDPGSPLGIPGDQRNWDYNTAYTIDIYGFLDYASDNQDQLGDPNGPNTSTFICTTEDDTEKPQTTSVSPASGSSGNSPSANLSIEVLDKKTYPGNISGTGVSSTSCRITVSSASFASTTYQQGSAGVTVTSIDYGYRYDINPVTDFGQNETVFVNVNSCQDLADTPNVMLAYPYSFSTADLDTPYIDGQVPANDASMSAGDNITFNIKDNGTVDLTNTVVYVNGAYYTNSGGAGAVITNGTRITFASSLNFNGGPGTGPNTAVSAISGGYHFVIDPLTDFAAGEAVPIIIYTRDTTGNIMERSVHVPVVGGGTCPGGSTYCGSNTTWDAGLGKCVGTGGGSSNAGGATPALTINPSNITAMQIDETSIMLNWYSSQPGSGRVVYGTQSPSDYGTSPNYSYPNSTSEKNDNSTYHSVIVSGLKPGVIYYLRPITKTSIGEIRGDEITMVTKFSQTDCSTCPIKEVTVCPAEPAVTPARPAISTPIRETQAKPSISEILKIINIRVINIQDKGNGIIINGTANPSSNLKLIIY